MLRLTVGPEDYLMIGDDIKIVFLGGSKNHTRIMLDIPKELNVVWSKAVEKHAENPEKKRSCLIIMRFRICRRNIGERGRP